jgi:hypothetical protein
MPNIDAFLTKRMATYVGKITRADHESLPKKFLTAWINGSLKNGAPQLSCNNNFADAIHKILPPEILSNRNAPLREWLALAKEESIWHTYIDRYFESCRKPDPSEDESDSEGDSVTDSEENCV